MTTTYQQIIADYLATRRYIDVTPRVIEAWMRSEHGTLDHLSRAEFHREIEQCRADALAAGPEMSDQLARSFGL